MMMMIAVATSFQTSGLVCNETLTSNYTGYATTPFYNTLTVGQSPSTSIKTAQPAVCLLSGFSLGHFAHFMQPMYGCISWWQFANDTHSQRKPILAVSRSESRVLHSNNAFISGILHSLQVTMNLTTYVIGNSTPVDMFSPKRGTGWEDSKPVNKRSGPVNERSAFIVHSSRYLNTFRDKIVDVFFHNQSTNGCTSSAKNTGRKPQIGILNRKGTRSIENVDRILNAIQKEFDTEVSIAYFEVSSFQDQVAFFSTTDILISPHGAQLTGVPFMPSCGQVLELFPKSYYIPGFYGSLANAAGLKYGYLYLSNGDPIKETQEAFQFRGHSRSVKLCPSTNKILAAVKTMVKNWEACCVDT